MHVQTNDHCTSLNLQTTEAYEFDFRYMLSDNYIIAVCAKIPFLLAVSIITEWMYYNHLNFLKLYMKCTGETIHAVHGPTLRCNTQIKKYFITLKYSEKWTLVARLSNCIGDEIKGDQKMPSLLDQLRAERSSSAYKMDHVCCLSVNICLKKKRNLWGMAYFW